MPHDADDSTTPAQLPWELMDEAAAAPAAVESAPVEPVRATEDSPAAYDDSAPDAVDYASPVPAEPLEEDLGPPPYGGGWAVAMLCCGIGLIACCVVIPQADAN